MYTELLIPKEVNELYEAIAGEDKIIQFHEFQRFLETHQFENHICDETIREMIKEFEKTVDDNISNDDLTIGLYGFAQYIRSTHVISQDKNISQKFEKFF
jgi:hypothetical protein